MLRGWAGSTTVSRAFPRPARPSVLSPIAGKVFPWVARPSAWKPPASPGAYALEGRAGPSCHLLSPKHGSSGSDVPKPLAPWPVLPVTPRALSPAQGPFRLQAQSSPLSPGAGPRKGEPRGLPARLRHALCLPRLWAARRFPWCPCARIPSPGCERRGRSFLSSSSQTRHPEGF